MAAQVKVVAQVSWVGLAGMPGPSLMCWLFVLITMGSAEPGVPPGAAARPAFARMAFDRRNRFDAKPPLLQGK